MRLETEAEQRARMIAQCVSANKMIDAKMARLDAAEAEGEDPAVAPRRIYGNSDIPGGYETVRRILRETRASNVKFQAQLEAGMSLRGYPAREIEA